jgi:hypothetical protein
VTGLARLFGVPPQYFFDEAETGRGAVPAEVAVALADDRVRDIALGASGLSEHSLAAVEQLIASVRALEDQPRPGARAKGARKKTG